MKTVDYSVCHHNPCVLSNDWLIAYKPWIEKIIWNLTLELVWISLQTNNTINIQ